MCEVRPRLPFEDLENSRYIHEHDRVISVARGEQADYYVDVDLFMDVQQERDDFRRTLGLINALRDELPVSVVTLLDRAGFSPEMGQAMKSIIAWARDGADT